MNLIVDVGNTFVKLAVFKDDKLLVSRSIEVIGFEAEFKVLNKKFPNIQSCIISSVGNLPVENIKLVRERLHVIYLDSSTPLPFENLYKTPTTLGVDRLALVSASAIQYPDKNVLIIDAGTCITFDFINNKNQYLGGAISPGVQMRYKSLNNLTANLPLLEIKEPKNLIGNTTSEAIHSGVINGVLHEIDGVIEAYKLKYADLTVILTGGNANFLSKQLKSSIFANSNFLLEGLNYILQFNSKE
ncbi:type III pantothenate kinase [Hanstruepera ponticola]|uniref:type III pantothenate kinase n=1 Tax=Hanstruepera ponticola TaxID=2042995 RepID=UPI000CF18B40|nr:type III pantothenate kinase [Hanstruepera ponticola]